MPDIFWACWAGFESEKGHFENNRGFLDSDNEWFFDEENVVLYVVAAPGTDLAAAELALPVAHGLIRLQGSATATVRDVVLRDLTFEHGAWAYGNFLGRATPTDPPGNTTYYGYSQGAWGMGGMIYGNFVERIAIASSQFRAYGRYGVSFGADPTEAQNRFTSYATDIVITDNVFTDGGGGAIRLANTLPTAGTLVARNTVEGTGRVFADAVAVAVWHDGGAVLTHNDVSDVPYSAIQGGGGCALDTSVYNEVSHNRVSRSMTRMRDGGGIYISSQYGVAKLNTVEPSGAFRAPDAPLWHPSFQIDVYLDDYASYWIVHDNDAAVTGSKSVTNVTPDNPISRTPAAGVGDGLYSCALRSPPAWWVTPRNVALASDGAGATASSSYGPG
jgi:hypothetical protein